jgi:hypothetical protein
MFKFTRVPRVAVPAAVSAMVLSALLASSALADPRDFTLENDSLSYITHVYVSPSSSNNWGEDVLGTDVLPPGRSVDISFNPNVGTSCIYDIMVVTDNGARTRQDRQNLCTTSTLYYSED